MNKDNYIPNPEQAAAARIALRSALSKGPTDTKSKREMRMLRWMTEMETPSTGQLKMTDVNYDSDSGRKQRYQRQSHNQPQRFR